MDKYIAIAIFVLVIIGACALIIYRKKKSNKDFTFDEFMETYTVQMLNVLKSVVEMLMINIDEFENADQYEHAIIHTTLSKLEENCKEFGIDTSLFNLVDKDKLTDALHGLLYDNHTMIFSDVDDAIEELNPTLLEEENELINNAEHSEDEEKCEPEVVDHEQTAIDESTMNTDIEFNSLVEDTFVNPDDTNV